MQRREFLGRSGVAVASALSVSSDLSAGLKREDKMIPIIDTHQHLWDLNKFKLPWVKKGDVLARSFVMKDYLDATEGLGIAKAVYMEVDVAPEQQAAEAEFIIDLCKSGKTPTVAAVISGRPASEKFKAYITNYKDSRYVKGVRQVLHMPSTPQGYCLAPEFVKGVQLLGELGMSYDLCMRHAELLDAAKLIDQCPDTRFVLDHCGNANVQDKDQTQWKRDISEVAKRKNVICKVSGIVASAKPGAWSADDLAPIINHTLDTFGPDRVIFGGDWPVCTLAATYKEWLQALQSIVKARPIEEQKKLFHDNAAKFYGL